MDKTIKIHQSATIGKTPTIGAYVLINEDNATQKTRIGDNATIRSHSVLYGGNSIGDNFHAGHGVLIRECNTIGDNVSIGSHSVIEHHISIGNNVRIHSNTFIPEYSVLEDNCWIGPCVVFTNARYPESPNVKKELIGPIIKRGAIVGANVTILPGVTIGEGALIGAGTVVTKDIPAKAVVIGNPMRIVKSKDDLPYEKNSTR